MSEPNQSLFDYNSKLITLLETGKLLKLSLGEELYGIDILRVIEIIRLRAITPVPGTPSFIKGVINLRGRIIPTVDLRTKLGLEEKEVTDKTCIIIATVHVDSKEKLVGFIVERVLEVIPIEISDIIHPIDFSGSIKAEYILTFVQTEEEVIVVLDIEEIMAKEEVESLDTVSENMKFNKGNQAE